MSWILDLEHQCGAKKLWLWDVRTDLLLFQLWKLRWCLVVRNRDENRLLFKVKSDIELSTSQGFIFSGAPWVELLLASAMVLLTASSPKGIWKLIPQGGDPKSGALEKWASPEDSALRGGLVAYKRTGENQLRHFPLSTFYHVGFPLRKDHINGVVLTTQHNSQPLGLPSLHNWRISLFYYKL